MEKNALSKLLEIWQFGFQTSALWQRYFWMNSLADPELKVNNLQQVNHHFTASF